MKWIKRRLVCDLSLGYHQVGGSALYCSLPQTCEYRGRIKTLKRQQTRVMANEAEEEDRSVAGHILPKFGWRVHLDHVYTQKPQPCYIPRWNQIPRLIGLGWR